MVSLSIVRLEYTDLLSLLKFKNIQNHLQTFVVLLKYICLSKFPLLVL